MLTAPESLAVISPLILHPRNGVSPQVIFDSMTDFMSKYKTEAIGIELKSSKSIEMPKKINLMVEAGTDNRWSCGYSIDSCLLLTCHGVGLLLMVLLCRHLVLAVVYLMRPSQALVTMHQHLSFKTIILFSQTPVHRLQGH